jgi:hypothetical protein
LAAGGEGGLGGIGLDSSAMLTSLLPALARKPLEYQFMVAGKNLGNHKK